jgi:hypothetical protein
LIKVITVTYTLRKPTSKTQWLKSKPNSNTKSMTIQVHGLPALLSNLAHVDLQLDRSVEALVCALGTVRLLYGVRKASRSSRFKDAGLLKNSTAETLLAKAKLRLSRALISLGEARIVKELSNMSISHGGKNHTVNCLGQEAADLANAHLRFPQTGSPQPEVYSATSTPDFIACDWVHADIEVRMCADERKGRGVFAKKNLEAGTAVMVVKHGGLEFQHDDDMSFGGSVKSLKHNVVSDASDVGLLARVVQRCADDVAFAWKLSHLHDGESGGDIEKSDIQLSFLCDRIQPFLLPLLPPSPVHLGGTLPQDVVSAVQNTSESRLESMLNLNSWGSRADSNQNKSFCMPGAAPIHNLPGSAERQKYLLPAISLLNHAKNNNCGQFHTRDRNAKAVSTVLWLRRDVKAGEELTENYSRDKDALRTKWGIVEEN